MLRVAEYEQSKGNKMTGAELGYRYEASPLIADEPGGPEHNFMEYTPTTWPGARLPHAWLATARPCRTASAMRSLIPCCGWEARGPIRAALARAFAALGAPLQILDIPDEAAARHLRL